MNIFNNPKRYLDFIKQVRIPKDVMEEKKLEHSGKSMLCAWLTKLCPARCSACFFKSNMYKDDVPKEKYELSEVGVDNLIDFINNSNNSYLMLSGGGEPMIRPKAVNKIIRETKTDRIVIVTSGIWANNYENAEKYIDELYESQVSRNDNTIVVLRLSIDEFHFTSPSLSYKHYENIINVFKNKFKDCDKFILRIHTMQDDPTLENIITKMGGNIIYEKRNGVTDNNDVIKIVPKKAWIEFPDSYKIFVGLSKLFLADIKADLRNCDSDSVRKALEVFEKDMKVSEYGNPSIITNCNGLQGLDFWSDYNGNITVWGCQQPDDLHSLYSSNYREIVDDTYNNIQSYSFLDKGYYYRRNIIRDVNPRAVLRSEVMNLRDYAGAFLIEENHTQLYYAIRVLKDYLKEGVLSQEDINMLPKELVDVVSCSENEINQLYFDSDYDIVVQYLSTTEQWAKEDFEDLFVLIRMGHYDIHSENLDKAIAYYNHMYGDNINSIEDVYDSNDEAQLARLHNRISPMENCAYQKCLKK